MQSPVSQTLGLHSELDRSLDRASRSKKLVVRPVRPYAVQTLHRPSNVDQPKTLKPILNALKVISKDLPVVFPAHPRTRARLVDFGVQRYSANMLGESQVDMHVGRSGLYCIDPLSYLDFLCLTAHSSLVRTDSGGIQEETTILGVPCVTIRENTERPFTVTRGTNVLAGVKTQAIIANAERQLRKRSKQVKPEYGDGKAGTRIVKILRERVRG